MLYCPKCSTAFDDGSRCPVCDNRKIRPLHAEEDLCFVVEEEPMWCEAIEDLFRDHQIPFCTRSADLAWIGHIGGPRFIRRKYYTFQPYVEQAKGLVESLFNAQPLEEDEPEI